ncbi:hypothetical protein AB0953_16590 [Streptomyces sp. NPDC046866]|uniref:hypothetical protein n=1 Tax=Streptomyces sp. NPDC046866 TaxID=3154921 RepID=UPI00345631BF
MFGKKTAAKLDTAARALHQAGKKVAGEKGGRAGDAIATAVLGPLRDRCACCDKDVCSHA